MDDQNRLSNHSVNVSGNATGNIIQTGDNNSASLHYQKVALPTSEVDIAREIGQIKHLLKDLQTPDRQKLANAISDVETELQKPSPEKPEVGSALERLLKYASKASNYIDIAESLKPHIVNAVAWLGTNWHSLLHTVGLSV